MTRCRLSSEQGFTSTERMPSNVEKQHTASEHRSSPAGNEAGDNGDTFMLPEHLVTMQVGGFRCSESEFVTAVLLFLRRNIAPRALERITILY